MEGLPHGNRVPINRGSHLLQGTVPNASSRLHGVCLLCRPPPAHFTFQPPSQRAVRSRPAARPAGPWAAPGRPPRGAYSRETAPSSGPLSPPGPPASGHQSRTDPNRGQEGLLSPKPALGAGGRCPQAGPVPLRPSLASAPPPRPLRPPRLQSAPTQKKRGKRKS